MIEIESGISQPFELLAAFDRFDFPPRGRDGGGNGAAGRASLRSGTKLKGKGTQLIPVGERLVIETSGGGGMGDPAKRDPAAIARDLEDELVSRPLAAKA